MPDWHSCETGSIRCLLMFCLRWHPEQHRQTRAFFCFVIDIVCLFSHPPSFTHKCQKIHLICEMIVKPKIIGNKTENVLNVSFFFFYLRLEGLLALYLSNNDIHNDFRILRCIFKIGGHTETLIHQEEKEGAGGKVFTERELSGAAHLSKHIRASTSLWGYH